jgi:hypothetical protein
MISGTTLQRVTFQRDGDPYSSYGYRCLWYSSPTSTSELGKTANSLIVDTSGRFPGDPGTNKLATGINDNPTFGAVQAHMSHPFMLRRSYNLTNWGVNLAAVQNDVTAGRIPVTSWKLSPYTLTTVPNSAIDKVCSDLKSVAPHPVWASIYHEPEENISTASAAGEYRALFRRTVNRCRTMGVTNVAWLSPFFMAPYTFKPATSGRDWRWWHPDWNGSNTHTVADWYTGTSSVVDADAFVIYIGTKNPNPFADHWTPVTSKMAADGYTPKNPVVGEFGVQADPPDGDPATTGATLMREAWQGMLGQHFAGVVWWNNGGNSFCHGPYPVNDPDCAREHVLADIVADSRTVHP